MIEGHGSTIRRGAWDYAQPDFFYFTAAGNLTLVATTVSGATPPGTQGGCGGFGGITSDGGTGLGGDDVICGGAGADILYGSTGDDALFGQGGNDRLLGHRGDDLLDGGAGIDDCDGGLDGAAGDAAVACETVRSVP